MHRLILNCWLLIAIVATVPNERDKRHLSYIKNFIISIFSVDQPTTPQMPILEIERQYELYRIPGFNDILIKILKCRPDELILVRKSEEDVNINAFESYVGTKSVKDTDMAFQNVYKLLSTGILNPPDNNVVQEIMVPIFNDLHFEIQENIKSVRINPGPTSSISINKGDDETFPIQEIGNNIQTFSVTSGFQPTTVQEIKTNVINNLREPFEPKYSTQPLKNNEPVMRLLSQKYPEVRLRQHVGDAFNIPRYTKPIINRFISLETEPNRSHGRKNRGYIHKERIPVVSEYYRSNKGLHFGPLNNMALPLLHSEKSVDIDVVNVVSLKQPHHMYDKITTTPNPRFSYLSTEATEISKLQNSDNKSNSSKVASTEKTIKEVNEPPTDKTSPQVNDILKVVKEKDEVNTQPPFAIIVNTSPEENIEPNSKITSGTTNAITGDKNHSLSGNKTNDYLPETKTLSQYIYDHVSRNKTHPVSLLKEKDDINYTDLSDYTPLHRNNVPIVSILDKNLKLNDIKNPDEKGASLIKNADNISKTKTLSQYIHNRVNHTNPHVFSKDTIKVKANLSIVNNAPLNNQLIHVIPKSHIKKENDDVAKINNTNIFFVKPKGTEVNTVRSHDIHNANVDPNNDMNIRQTNDSGIKVLEGGDSPVTIVKANDVDKDGLNTIDSLVNIGDIADDVPNDVNFSQFADDNFNESNILGQENELKTNLETNFPLSQEDFSISPIDKGPNVNASYIVPKMTDNNENIIHLFQDENDVKTNAVTNSPLSKYNDYAQPITNSPPVENTTEHNKYNNKEIVNTERVNNTSSTKLSEEKLGSSQTSLKDPIVVVHDTNVHHKNNISGSLTAVNENQDRDSDQISETKPRGDIPDQ